MENIFENLLNDRIGDYIIPFFWQRHEDEKTIREYMRKIRECGIKQVCLESRPHPDFCGPDWWQDTDIIFDEADKLNMRVWILDDKEYPTGIANGKGAELPLHLKKSFLCLKQFDATGPKERACFVLEPYPSEEQLKIVSAVAISTEIKDGEAVLTDKITDISSYICKDRIYWNVPKGTWKICIVEERIGDLNDRLDTQINPITAESTELLIKEVYEKHYGKYKERFGKSFAGFFSDEPGFYNLTGFNGKLGADPCVRLPWGIDMPAEMEREEGKDWRLNLPFLWLDLKQRASRVRYDYMNSLTKLYEKNFSRKIGDWCKRHNVEYIGHIVEDNNTHSRLAIGAGHYFRALAGQDMAGVDVVLNQLIPDLDYKIKNFCEWDGEFFHYALAKLGSSLARTDAKKQNRALCEIFGAYGWHEGLKLMKWLADHMLVRGINYFVPHAFSMAEFPDEDCPPHFYAHGNNPQFPYFGKLVAYMNRMSYLSLSGKPKIKIAVLYHAESEWCGDSMLLQKPAKEFTQSQIDFDIISADCLALCESNTPLTVNGNKYEILIIPFAEILPLEIAERIAAAAVNTRVIFINSLPKEILGDRDKTVLKRLSTATETVPLEELAELLHDGYSSIRLSNNQKFLRCRRTETETADIYFLFNESSVLPIDTSVLFEGMDSVYRYDAMDNRFYETETQNVDGNTVLKLKLAPYEACVLINGNVKIKAEVLAPEKLRSIPIDTVFDVSMCEYNRNSYKKWGICSVLPDMSSPDTFPYFSGTFCYETDIQNVLGAKKMYLDLGKAYETVRLVINDNEVGVLISPPYIFDIKKHMKSGSNHISVYVTNTLSKAIYDPFSADVQQEPSGLMGPIRLLIEE